MSILSLWCGKSRGQASCLPQYNALQTIEDSSRGFVHPLIAQNSQGLFVTRVLLEGVSRDGVLRMKIQFDPAWQGVSLPYNLYAVMVISDGAPLAWFDYTNGCQGPGLGFFPGRVIELPQVKLPATPSQKLQIMVWGKL